MSKEAKDKTSLGTVWCIPDALWDLTERILAVYDSPKRTGRPRINARKAINGLIYRARTGCQWNQLPKEFGNDASIHRTMQRWEGLGVFDLLWALLLTKCEELSGVDWQWQAADGCLSKARGVPKKGATRKVKHKARNALVPTRPTVVKRASRKACLSRAEAVRLLSASPGPPSMMLRC